jgi:hypothetical protein
VNEEWPIRMLILDRGFVYVCRCPDPQQHALWLPYTDRRTVRRWGATQGLGQLVSGPTAETVLEALVPAGQVPVRAILDVVEVEQEKWVSHLKATPAVSTPRPVRS